MLFNGEDNMKYLSLVVVPCMVALFTPMVFCIIQEANRKKEAKMNKDDFIICYSLGWTWLSIITSVVLAIILILLNIFYEVKWVVNVIMIPFIVIFIVGAYAFVREKVVIKKDEIIVTPILGKTKIYTFTEIEKLKEVSWSNGTISYKVYKEKVIFSISNSMLGYNLFMARVKAEKIKVETVEEQVKNHKIKDKKKTK